MKTPTEIKALIALSILAGESRFSLAYFNRGLPVDLPKPQTAGTERQRVTYAQLEADKIFDRYGNA